MKVGIVGQRGNPRAVALVGDLAEELARAGASVVVDETTRAAFDRENVWREAAVEADVPPGVAVEALADCDLAVSVGGDGTFLYSARGAETTPIMGVNLGEVGFLNAVPPEDAVDAALAELERYRETGSPRTRAIPRLQAATDDWTLAPALNEVVVQGRQRGHGEGCSVEVRVDGALYTSGHADGVLVATAAGSTAYNLSEGGPLVHPEVPGFVVTDMCGAEAMPPLVVDVDSEVTVRIDDAEAGVVVSDGRLTETVDPPTEVRLSRAGLPVNIAGPPLDFFTALGKLG
ncbi:NAD(+)/NADH kinase [Halobacteriales archaeon Cl-PHB]